MRERTTILPNPNRSASGYVILHASAFILLFATSCASLPELPWAPVARDASAGFYETARLEYQIDAGKLGQPLDVLRVDGRQVNYEQIASSPLPDRSVGTLVIQKPHPAGRAGFARVTFSIDSSEDASESKSWNPFTSGDAEMSTIGHHDEVHEIWAMDVPDADADQYFKLLSMQSFYAATAPEKAPAKLAVTLDGRHVEKNWEPLPELNDLAQRVRREGRLVAYLRPEALAGDTTSAIASVRAYRELLAKTAAPVGSAPTQAAGIVAPQSGVASRNLPYAAR